MLFDDNNEAINSIEKMLNYPVFKKVKTNIAISYPVNPIIHTPKEEEKVNKKEEKDTERNDAEIIKELTKRFREISDEKVNAISNTPKDPGVTISKLSESKYEKKPTKKDDETNRSIEEKVKSIVQDYADEDDDEWDDDAKLYDELREFIEDEFMAAFLWFMKNSYDNVSFAHQHKRRVYKIYKEITDGGNIYGKCHVDDSCILGCCNFDIRGSKKAVINYNNNKRAKYAKVLAKYIIASNTAPFVMDLMNGSINCDEEYLEVIPSICGTRPVGISEMYTKVLEKVCFGRDF